MNMSQNTASSDLDDSAERFFDKDSYCTDSDQVQATEDSILFELFEFSFRYWWTHLLAAINIAHLQFDLFHHHVPSAQ